ncbi:MAG: peptidylprolyl isomerase [Anaerolineaceae bacterium]|nr:peptidylprolyl isomerase [Anaerolineaceae bacterium]
MANQPPIETKKHVARKQKEEKQTKIAITVSAVILAVVVGLLGYVLINNYIVRPNIVVAKVGETEIKAGEYQSSTSYARMNMLSTANQYVNIFGEMGKQYALPMLVQLNQTEQFGRNILDEMIDDVLVKEEAEKRGITVSNEEIQKAMQEQYSYYPEGTNTPSPTSEPVYTPTWSASQLELINPTNTPEATEEPEEGIEDETDLPVDEENVDADDTDEEVEVSPTEVPTEAPTATPYTESLYKENVKEYQDALSPYGIDKKDLERFTRNSLLRTKLIEDMTKDMQPVEEQVWVRHILVATEDLAKEVIEKSGEGEDWNVLASEYSTDEANKDNGGDLGWIGRSDSYDADFLNGAFKLTKEGEISEPVSSQFGYHIIQLVARATNPVNDTKFNQMKQDFFSDWLEVTRDFREDIVINDVALVKVIPTTPAVPSSLMEYVTSSNS